MKIDYIMAYPKPTEDSPYALTPLSILFPGAMFEHQGKHVEYWDERFDPMDELLEMIPNAKNIGVSAFTGQQTGRAARLLIKAKQLNPFITTHIGGHHARIMEKEVLAEPFVDKVWPLRSYGEEHFPYNKRTKKHYERTDLQYFTSRGCPFPCTFCALSSPWEPKPINDLDYELKTIHGDIGFEEVSFSDPNISFGAWKDEPGGKTKHMDRVDRIRDIGKVMRDIGAKWDGNIRSPHFKEPGMIDALVESNCFSLEIGCESGNDNFLKKVIKKGHGVDSIMRAAELMGPTPISVMYSFISAMPRETEEMRHDTYDLIDWIVDTDPSARISIYNYAPYPGSPMYDDAVAGTDGFPVFNPPTTMEGWGSLRLMLSPIYWIAGLNFRMDNTRKNFPGEEYELIRPYVDLAQQKWKDRDMDEFPCEEVEKIIGEQIKKTQSGGDDLLANVSV